MELQGKVIAALPERSGVSQRGEWKSQEFVIETHDAQYPRKLVFTVFGIERLQRFNIQVGQEVLVAFDIDAHEWNGRWFNDVRAFDVRQVDPMQYGAPQAAPVAAQPVSAAPVSAAPTPSAAPAVDSAEDLPF
ncbi:MAG: DUF3127 domain-containing protein [Prevotellaceae bacterium]|nr:DUF3127 domain-containing protein [Prevotellaceae bacterium]MDY2750437.1 DUF3127 domain-containing protein [Prevotella sp.]